MAPPYRRYAEELSKNLAYGATWTPGMSLTLGTIGRFREGIFVPISHLSAVGVSFHIRRGITLANHTYTSVDSVALTFKASGQPSTAFRVLADVDAGVAIDFRQRDAIVFAAVGCREDRIDDLVALERQLRQFRDTGQWKDEWAIVTHLLEAESATVILSSSNESRVELRSTVNVAPTHLAELAANVSLSFADDMYQLVIARNRVTPLHHTVRLRKKFWSAESYLELKGSAATQTAVLSPTESAFERVDFDEE